MTTKRIAIQFCSPVAGDLYRVFGEDGELHVYAWTFHATCADGRTYVHNTHSVRGAVADPEGFMVANYAHRQESEAFALRVNERGSIDPALWTEITIQPYDLAAQWAADAAREDLERRGLIPEL